MSGEVSPSQGSPVPPPLQGHQPPVGALPAWGRTPSPTCVSWGDLDDRHIYLATSCRHGKHEHCKSEVSKQGNPKVPAQCKFCHAPCVCWCHNEQLTEEEM